MRYNADFIPLSKKNCFTLAMSCKQKGFSLIEIIIGMVVMSIAFAVISTLILPTEQQSADQLHQIKAAELAQSFLNEINGKAFDENSDKAGGRNRCGETLILDCTEEVDFGPEGEEKNADGSVNRDIFDDVDDYHNYQEVTTSTESDYHKGYNSFELSIIVSYDGNNLNLSSNDLAKKITVTVTTPLGSDIVFSSYRANY